MYGWGDCVVAQCNTCRGSRKEVGYVVAWNGHYVYVEVCLCTSDAQIWYDMMMYLDRLSTCL